MESEEANLNVRRTPAWLAAVPGILGIALHAFTAIFKSSGGGGDAFIALLFAWSCFPYAICLIALLRKHRAFAVLGSAGCLAVDSAMHYSVFISPTSSTAALGLLFSPLINLVAALPLAMIAAWGLKRVFARVSS